MKVEWKKFSEEKPDVGRCIWVFKPEEDGDVTWLFKVPSHDSLNFKMYADCLWAYIDMPDAPEEQIKIRLKDGLYVDRMINGYGWILDVHGRTYSFSKEIFEEVNE